MSTTMRVSEATRAKFAQMSAETGRPMAQLLDEAADALERRLFFDAYAARYAELRADPAGWSEVLAERAEWDTTLLDGQ